MKKISVVIINRSNYARLKPLLIEIKKSKKIKLSIITGSSSILSKYGDASEQIKRDGFKIDYEFYSHLAGENIHSMTKSTGLIILELSTILSKINPNLILISADGKYGLKQVSRDQVVQFYQNAKDNNSNYT